MINKGEMPPGHFKEEGRFDLATKLTSSQSYLKEVLKSLIQSIWKTSKYLQYKIGGDYHLVYIFAFFLWLQANITFRTQKRF